MSSGLIPQANVPVAPPAYSLSSLRALVEDDLQKVDNLILKIGESRVDLVLEMAKHIIGSGGKRLRPMLTLLCAKLCGYKGVRHIDIAAAVEFMHTATLLHDDVVDDSKLRRGEATANALWDNKSSVLVGDFLLGQAFRLMVGSESLRALDILSRAASVIAEGEVMQLVATNNIDITRTTYIDIISAKTATLFSAACEISPVLAGSPEPQVAALQDFGMNLGIAFQIVDDALDYSAHQEKLGKTIGDDFREGKVTLPVIIAYEQGDTEEKAFWRRTMSDLNQQEGDLERAITIIRNYYALQESVNEARNYAFKAAETLKIFPECKEKDVLADILAFAVEREY